MAISDKSPRTFVYIIMLYTQLRRGTITYVRVGF